MHQHCQPVKPTTWTSSKASAATCNNYIDDARNQSIMLYRLVQHYVLELVYECEYAFLHLFYVNAGIHQAYLTVYFYCILYSQKL